MEESDLRRGGEGVLNLEKVEGVWPIRYATRARPGEAVAIREPRGSADLGLRRVRDGIVEVWDGQRWMGKVARRPGLP
jgi:hypothetical protein